MNIVIPTQKLAQAQAHIKAVTQPDLVDKALYSVAQRGVDIILKRTKKGVGIKGGFAPYTKAYAAWKRKQGHARIYPNLELTGDMMRDMQSAKHRSYSEIYFTSKSSADKARGNNRKRPFFGFNSTEKSKLIKRFVMTYLSLVDKQKTAALRGAF